MLGGGGDFLNLVVEGWGYWCWLVGVGSLFCFVVVFLVVVVILELGCEIVLVRVRGVVGLVWVRFLSVNFFLLRFIVICYFSEFFLFLEIEREWFGNRVGRSLLEVWGGGIGFECNSFCGIFYFFWMEVIGNEVKCLILVF